MGEIKEMNDEELNQVNGGINNNYKGSGKTVCCQYCGKSFGSGKELRNHIKSAHPGEPVVY